MRPEEMESLEASTRLEQLHVYWGAKESLYKAYGRRLLDFREHIAITPFAFKASGGEIYGRIRKDQFAANYQLQYELMGNYILVYGHQE